MRPTSRGLALVGTLALAACTAGPTQMALDYQLAISPADVIRIETRVSVAPGDLRTFYADAPYREVATGIGYEVRDVDKTGTRLLFITHDATLGFQPSARFTFTLLPPVKETAPPVLVTARAYDANDLVIAEVVGVTAHFSGHNHVAIALADARCGGQLCPADQKCCNQVCIPVASDAANCGACGTVCAPGGDGCTGGACRCGAGSACAGSETCCSAGCFDLQTDAFHCGACGKACNTGETCVAGACTCNGGAACSGGNTVCCAATSTTPGCQMNSCGCGTAGLCAAPKVCCGGSSCVDVLGPSTQADSNCGGCGVACTAPLKCAMGGCACAGNVCNAGDACCASGCAHFANDPANCGACDKKCNAGETCAGGNCVCGTGPMAAACPMGLTCCGGACVDTTQDMANCGGCTQPCKTGELCTQSMCSCNNGPACVGNQRCCNMMGCFDTSMEPQHCGSCTMACAANQACANGMCVATPCLPPCTQGNTCNTASATCQCQGQAACTNGQQCCSSGCKALLTDHDNCGTCGHACKANQQCCNAHCVSNTGTLTCGSCTTACVGQVCCNCQNGIRCVATHMKCQQCQ